MNFTITMQLRDNVPEMSYSASALADAIKRLIENELAYVEVVSLVVGE